MKKSAAILTTLTLAAFAAGAASAQTSGSAPVVRVYRSLLNDGTTSVEGFFRVDPEILGTQDCAYVATIDVIDVKQRAEAKQLDKWDSKCPTRDGEIAPALERFLFGLPAGMEVAVDVSVAPKANDKNRKVNTVRIKALDSKSKVSDLILGRKVGVIDSTTSATEYNMRHNTIGIRGGTDVVLDPESSDVSYYLEMYPAKGKAFNGTASMVIRREGDNTELTRRELQKIVDVKVPTPIAGNANLGGLADGDYTFELVLQLADTTIVASHSFKMMTPQVVVASADAGGATGYFYTLPDSVVEKTFGAAVMFGMSKEQMDLYNTLSTNGKRGFLTRYFGTEMPDPNRKPESLLDAFLARSNYVQSHYSERAGRGRQEGWRTDRGRIYIRRGEPTNMLSRPSPRGGSPYELFYYANNRGLFYLFIDDTRAGNYRLMYTNDPAEQSEAGWDRKVGQEAVEDMRSLGIRVVINN